MADCSVLRRAPNLSGAEDGPLALPLGNAAKSTITVEFSSATAGRVTLPFLTRRAPLPAGARPWYARNAALANERGNVPPPDIGRVAHVSVRVCGEFGD